MNSYALPRNKQECFNCYYWEGEERGKQAECRRRAPDPTWLGMWPVTDWYLWCGEWAPREEDR